MTTAEQTQTMPTGDLSAEALAKGEAADSELNTENLKLSTPLITESQLVWLKVSRCQGVPLAVAKRVFGEDPRAIIAELNDVLVA